MELDKRFRKENPLSGISAAHMLYFRVSTFYSNQFNRAVENLIMETGSRKRAEEIRTEAEALRAMNTPEELMKLIRLGYDNMNQISVLCKALEMEEAFMPLMLRRYRTTNLESVVETGASLLCLADPKWAEEVWSFYSDIRWVYAQSEACVAFGLLGWEDRADFLLSEYRRMKRDCPDDTYANGPLFALYALAGDFNIPKYRPFAEAIAAAEAADGQSADGQSADGQSADGQSADGQSADGQSADSQSGAENKNP